MSGYKKIRKKIKYEVIYLLVRSLVFISGVLPRRAWLTICGVLGKMAYRFLSKTRRLMHEHIATAFPEKTDSEVRRLAKETFKMLGKNAGEILRASHISNLEDLNKILVTHEYEHFEKAMAKGKGVIFLTAHLGAFDLMVTNMALRGFAPNIIGTPLKDRRLNDLLWKYRNQHGAVAIERGRETFRMIKVLKSGGLVALLIDQDTNVKSEFVDFFGKPASTPVGAAVLAMKTGAIIVPTYVYLGDDGMQHMHFLPEVPMRYSGDENGDVIFNTQVMTTLIEGWIRKHPSQWVWMHRRWRRQPETKMSNPIS